MLCKHKLLYLIKVIHRFTLLFALALAGQFSALSNEYNVLDYGAVSDGKTMCTQAIQKAIDAAHKAGGGKVVISKGVYLSGSIILKSGVELHLDKKAKLLGSTNPADYIRLNRWLALIMADKSRNIAITGNGEIDGQGLQLALHVDSLFYKGTVDSANYNFGDKRSKVTVRPQIIEFVNCRDIKVTGVTIRNAASWVQSYLQCRDLEVDGIRVESDSYWNNDGIDIIDCKQVRISNSYFNCSDDGICLKSYNHPRDKTTFCDSIYIGGCTVRSSASAIKFGTASNSGFKNVTIENIKVFDTYRSAIALESYHNGILENVLIQNVKAKNTGNAIFIRLGKRFQDERVGKVRNVTIRDVKVAIASGRPDKDYIFKGPALPYFHNPFPSSIAGIPGYPVKDVLLENICITYPGGGHPGYANAPISRLDNVPEKESDYPEFSMFGELPAWGFYIRHVAGLEMKNVALKLKTADYRPAFVFDDAIKVKLQSIQVKGDNKSNPIVMHNSAGVEMIE